MILHSIIPPEAIFPEEPAARETRQMSGGYIQGVNVDGKFTISRLISTDPKLYLDPRYAPGSTLK